MKRLFSWLPNLWSNPVSLLGTIITTVAGFALLLGLAIDLASPVSNNYTSIMLFVLIPGIFVLGLTLIPVGMWIEKKRGSTEISAEKTPLRHALEILLTQKKARRWMLFVLLATGANVILVGAAGARFVHFMDSPKFCGTQCHQVMEPEWTSYQDSPHAKVKCVECHIGPGATWAAKAKIDGLRQVWKVATGTYSTPVPSPVTHLRPARDTCEKCHWPAKFIGNKLTVKRHYAEDEENSEEFSVLALHIGGENPTTGRYQGIHWHVSPNVQVKYEVLDDRREKIGKVVVSEGGKVTKTFNRPGNKKTGTIRVMDCLDCHNRPTHVFDRNAGLAVDRAIREGKLDKRLPFIRKFGAAAIAGDNLQLDHLEQTILSSLKKSYQKEAADKTPSEAKLKKASTALAALYRRNVFPKMKVAWGTHPNHLGHPGGEEQQNGCFRCHNDEHVDKKDENISQDCDLCHSLINYEETYDDISDEVKELIKH